EGNTPGLQVFIAQLTYLATAGPTRRLDRLQIAGHTRVDAGKIEHVDIAIALLAEEGRAHEQLFRHKRDVKPGIDVEPVEAACSGRDIPAIVALRSLRNQANRA